MIAYLIINQMLYLLKGITVLAACLLVVIFTLPSQCTPGGYGNVNGGYTNAGSGGAYSGRGSEAYSENGSGYNSGPKSNAVDALKSLYNNQNGYNYNFGYDVKDYVYGNQQSRHESGSADPKGVTKGSYSLVEPDGSVRTVNYEADWVNGFRATVSDKNGVTQHGYNTGYGSDNLDSYGKSSTGYNGNSHY
ncbi:hypothetical protein CHUAL_006732 [Chamberlinius hualienensis]